MLLFQAQQGQVTARIAPGQHRVYLAAVWQQNVDFFLAFDNVIGRQYQVCRIGDPAGWHAPASVNQYGGRACLGNGICHCIGQSD